MPEPLLQPSGGLAAPLIAQLDATAKELADELFEIQFAMHEKPELAFKEFLAHDLCTDYMEKKGWKVTRHAYGLDTAWEAVYEIGSGGPVIGYNSEMDSLKGIGHACGHNIICVSGMSAAISTARLLERYNVAAKIVLLGTPAEEVHGGKIYMLQRGAYKDMEACLMTHPHIRGHGAQIITTPCIAAFSIKYTGASAHAGASPEKGVNALDAAVTAYTSIAMLRQQMPSSHRITNVIQGSEGFISNNIPNKAGLWVGVRAPTAAETYTAVDRIINCLKAGALASGCSYEISREHLYMDLQQSKEFENYFEEICPEEWMADGYHTYRAPITAGTDFGNVSWYMPSLHPLHLAPDIPAGDYPHSDTYSQHTGTRSAMMAGLRCGTQVAVLGARMVIDRPWAQKVTQAWEQQMADIDGYNIRTKLEKLFESYPLSKDIESAICACH